MWLILLPAGFAGGAQQSLHGHVPAAARELAPLGGLDGGKHLGLVISLPLRNQEALTNLLRELYDPASTNYHRYLAPEEFAERFGPAEADYQVVQDFATANGLTIRRTYSNRMLLDVDGAVTNIERAFQLHLQSISSIRRRRAPFLRRTRSRRLMWRRRC